MLFNKISRYLQFKISTIYYVHNTFCPDYISAFVSAYSCLGPSLIPGAILPVWVKSECRGGRMQKMMCCIDCRYVDCPSLHWYCCPFGHRQHQSFRQRGRGSAAVYRHSVLTEKMAHCLKLLHTRLSPPGCGDGDGLLLARDWEEIQLNRFSWPLHSTPLPASSE